jgi:hypothetical protein
MQAMESSLEHQRQALREEHDRRLEIWQQQAEAAFKQRMRAVEQEAAASVADCERRVTAEQERSAQACRDVQADNDGLQERLDEVTADVYLLRQENAHLKSHEEMLAEVRRCPRNAAHTTRRVCFLPQEVVSLATATGSSEWLEACLHTG